MSQDPRLLVISPAPEFASRVNSALRGAGIVAQVEWSRDADDAKELLEQPAYDLVFCELPRIDAATIVKLAARHAPPLPVIGLSEELDEDVQTAGFKAGLRDIVMGTRSVHVAAVARRELEALAAQRAVQAAGMNVEAAVRERDTLFAQSGDALARVEDGILVDANSAWNELFGAENAEAGVPVMDLFDSESRPRVKAALRKGDSEPMDLVAVGSDGLTLPVGVSMRALRVDGRELVEMAIRSGRGQRTLAAELEKAQRLDPDTGLLNRNAFLEELSSRPNDTLLVIRIDQFARVVEQMGVIGSDAVAVQFAKLVGMQGADTAALGRLDGSMFGVAMRVDRVQAEQWCERVREAIGNAVFEHAGRSTPLTASFGIRLADGGEPAQRLDDASAALRTARAGGGNRVEVYAPPVAEAPEETTVTDAEWTKRIKRALMQNQFRLAFQPIASLRGEASEAHDALLRLADPEHGEILPGEFLPAAERIGLMVAIDRWVLAHALKKLAEPAHRKKGTSLFVRLSDASLTDPTTVKWMDPQIRAQKLEPGRLVLELSAAQAKEWLKESRAVAEAVKAAGCGVLVGHLGADQASVQLMQHLPLDYLKFDAAVFENLGSDKDRQQSIRALLEQAREKGVQTIAPGIEDANTMALLWQLGVDFVQGNYLQEPEVVIADG